MASPQNDPLRPYSLILIAVLIVICMPFFHGAALIAALVLLFGMAIFSENRLAYLAVAVCSVASALLQARFFSGGASRCGKPYLPAGIRRRSSGSSEYRGLFGKVTACLDSHADPPVHAKEPVSFHTDPDLRASHPFRVPSSESWKEITANHKFIQISLILFTRSSSAGLLAFLWKPFSRGKENPDANPDGAVREAPRHRAGRILTLIGTRILAVILLTLTASGVSEWIVYYNINKNSVEMNLESPMVTWIESNTEPRSVFLTAPFAMNTFFLSGRFAYYGHPYYAWSAGYDTDGRKAIYAQLLTGCGGNLDAFTKLCHQENISYILVDNDLRNVADFTFDESFFNNNLKLMASFPDENSTIIYKVGAEERSLS